MTQTADIIVEWENALLSDIDRAEEMLLTLGEQATEFARDTGTTFNLNVVYDPDAIDVDVPKSVVIKCIDQAAWPGDVNYLAAPKLEYYDQKNFGAENTSGDVLIFIDSDVIPEKSWLSKLLTALEDPDVKLVSGSTYQSTEDFFERTSALFWNFGVRNSEQGLVKATSFYANNFAAKRDHIGKYPFEASETFRNQCSRLAKKMLADGENIYRIKDAWVSHPPTEGVKHFIHRAICQGHDQYLSQKMKNNGVLRANPIGSLFRWIRGLIQTPTKVFRRNSIMKFGFAEILTAHVLSAIYITLTLFGELLTFISPKLVTNNFEI